MLSDVMVRHSHGRQHVNINVTDGGIRFLTPVFWVIPAFGIACCLHDISLLYSYLRLRRTGTPG